MIMYFGSYEYSVNERFINEPIQIVTLRYLSDNIQKYLTKHKNLPNSVTSSFSVKKRAHQHLMD